MSFDRIERNMEAFSDLAVFQPVKSAEDEHLSATLRQGVHDSLYLTCISLT